MTQIIGFSGRATSGKNTCCNFILGHCMTALNIVRGAFKVTNQGQLFVEDIFGDTTHQGIIDVTNPNKEVRKFWNTHLDPYVKLYSLADLIKQNICIDLLGLSYESVYGNNEQKSQVTTLLWENMPGVITQEKWNTVYQAFKQTQKLLPQDLNLFVHDPGPMSGREVMQYVGTNIFRRMYENIWADALVRRIQNDNPAIALVCDVRFPGEVAKITENNGVVIRLTRVPYPEMTHESELALDRENFNWDNFQYILDNTELDIPAQNMAIYQIMKELNLVVEK